MVQFRSETMLHGTLVIPSDRAHQFIDALGRQSTVQIVDMNADSGQRQYQKYIQRIDEMERILRFLFEEINKLPSETIVKNQVDNFLEFDNAYQLDMVEDSLRKLYEQFVKFRENNDALESQKTGAVEERAVAIAATRSLQPDLRGDDTTGASDGAERSLLDEDVEQGDGGNVVGFSNVAGVIPLAEQEKFARTIFRATRGNAYTHFETITDEEVDKMGKTCIVMKNVFVIYHQGTMQSAVAERILRICQAFGVRRYTWPRTFREAEKRIIDLTEMIAWRSHALEAYEGYFMDEIEVLLKEVRRGGNSLVEEWRMFCLKEKALYATLNLFEGSDATLRADCWYPAAQESTIRHVLMSQSNLNQVSAFLLADHRPLPKSQTPPTYFRCPEFTSGFQDFVNTYGVPRYKEANPALTTIITLPFLFGIMYGDVGHGFIVFLTGLYMVLFWHSSLKNSDNEIVHLIGGGRYMLLLMGFFATYTGLLYNDFFALGMDIFGTRYVNKPNPDHLPSTVMERDITKGVYPFGFDPAWKGATNEIDMFNSFKMKFAIIIGFIQMTFGICHKVLNAVHFSDHLTLWFEAVPQLLFLTCLVGYMDFLIVFKWVTDLSHPKPSLIQTAINMFFFKSEALLFEHQGTLQMILVFIVLGCIPWMLLPKPLLMRRNHMKSPKRRESYHQQPEEMAMIKGGGGGGGDRHPSGPGGGDNAGVGHEMLNVGGESFHEEEFNFGEEMIHQMIETIEFVLGSISNTASYLRLWALSLAHQQLALVFFENTVLRVLEMSGVNVVLLGILLFFAFGVFAMITLAVMLGMDSLECFLHALRLQWVEFQNKFYKADGHEFKPFSYQTALMFKDE